MIMCVLLCYPVSIHMSQLLSTGRPISSFSPNHSLPNLFGPNCKKGTFLPTPNFFPPKLWFGSQLSSIMFSCFHFSFLTATAALWSNISLIIGSVPTIFDSYKP